MSWISDFAGKAEKLLNKIDHNAAIILKNDGRSHPRIQEESTLNEVQSESKDYKARYSPPVVTKNNTGKLTRSTHSSPSISVKQEEDHLIEFLNNSAAIDIDQLEMLIPKESVVNGHAEKPHSDPDDIHGITNENKMLKNEIRSVNSELSLLLNRTKSAEKDFALAQDRLKKSENEAVRLGKELNSMKEKLSDAEKYANELYAANQSLKDLNQTVESNSAELANAEAKISELKLEGQKREEALRADILALQTRLDATGKDLIRIRNECASELAEVNTKLKESRSELDQYRTKALKTLNEKDRLIAELKKAGLSQDTDEIVSMELEQLRNERVSMAEDLKDFQTKLEVARNQVIDAEKRLELARADAAETLKATETRLADETARRLCAEEYITTYVEEIHTIREELARQKTQLTQKVRDRDTELSRLRAQMARHATRSPPPPAQVEERISSLTSALVRKQAALEQTAKERNELRLQLDQSKNQFRDYISQVQGRAISVNDTDDAKLQVPSFFLESPFDTGVTRRVKRAYSSLDAVSIRTGVFLRRYPLARIFVFCYVILLHLWVCLVLFSYTPETKI